MQTKEIPEAFSLSFGDEEACSEECRWCGCCAQDAWSIEEECFNDVLGELPEGTWAASSGGGTLPDQSEVPTMSDLYDMSSGRRGWESVVISWDGSRRLTASFTSYGEGAREVVLTLLSKEEERIAECWASTGYFDDEVGSAVLKHERADLLLTETIVERLAEREVGPWEDPRSVGWEFPEILEAVKGRELSEAEIEIFVGLALNWDGELAELVETAVSV